ncbi:hypothetical protein FBU59_005921 [Linderina macrospora]|uniref:Uncharacterized protein n=1 Tax=Linderina macrospora TaxID=4868 RepID=A0ACC1J1B7_9FUNG|nr:hypothetical protein FBU59_005921 [Linderina macrospora]
MVLNSSTSITGRLKEEPLVAVGTVATMAAFTYASIGVYRRRFKQSQWGMRGRVIMQGLTVAALVGYGFMRNKEVEKTPKLDARPINWERLEREAREAEQQGSEKVDPAIAKLTAKLAKQKEAASVFAADPSATKPADK